VAIAVVPDVQHAQARLAVAGRMDVRHLMA
jgi:hypothetical protein